MYGDVSDDVHYINVTATAAATADAAATAEGRNSTAVTQTVYSGDLSYQRALDIRQCVVGVSARDRWSFRAQCDLLSRLRFSSLTDFLNEDQQYSSGRKKALPL